MPIWIVLAALGSILVTAVLAWVLWRMNAPPSRGPREAHGDSGSIPVASSSGGRERDHSDHGDGGGGDGGGGD